MRRSIATVCLSGTLEEKLEAAAAAGFDGVELFEPDLIASALRPSEVRDRADDLGLEIGLYQPFRDFEAVPEPARQPARAPSTSSRSWSSSVPTCCSSARTSRRTRSTTTRSPPRSSARSPSAPPTHGIRIAYEALAWGRHVSDYEHAWRIVGAADHPTLGTCLDSFHILSRGSGPGGHPRHPRRQDLLPPARRRAASW